MKHLIGFFTLIVVSGKSHSQLTDELFNQKKTQKEYLLKQIAALHLYIGYVKEGIDVAQKGLNTISNIKQGDYNLHNDFFSSLKNVNPKIKNYTRVADIIAMQVNIIKQYNKACQQVREDRQFTSEEVKYIKGVFGTLLSQSAANIDELITLTSSGKLELKDAERLQRIDKLYGDMEEKYSFIKHFREGANILSILKYKEQDNINRSRALFGLPLAP